MPMLYPPLSPPIGAPDSVFYGDQQVPLPVEMWDTLETPTVDKAAMVSMPRWPSTEADLMFDNAFETLKDDSVNLPQEFGAAELNLDSLDSSVIDQILSETAPDQILSETAPDQILSETAPVPVRSVSLDHDYCDQDWQILSEFLDLSRSPGVKSELDALQPFPSFMDTNIDLNELLQQTQDFKDSPPSESPPPVAKGNRYRQRRDKNNEASRKSRLSAKVRRQAAQMECEALAKRNADLKAELEKLETLRDEWKAKLMHLVAK